MKEEDGDGPMMETGGLGPSRRDEILAVIKARTGEAKQSLDQAAEKADQVKDGIVEAASDSYESVMGADPVELGNKLIRALPQWARDGIVSLLDGEGSAESKLESVRKALGHDMQSDAESSAPEPVHSPQDAKEYDDWGKGA